MHHSSATCLVAALLLAAAPASAASKKSQETALAARAAPLSASSPTVRLAALITSGPPDASGRCPSPVVVRGKGVASVKMGTDNYCGQFCITPSVKLDLATIVPVVLAEYSGSAKEVNIVQWRSSGIDCPAGTIAVIVTSWFNENNAFGSTAPVAITIIVP